MLVAVVLGAYFLAAQSTARAKSSTYDELGYLAAGLRYLRSGDVGPEVEGGYGPVAPALAAIPLRTSELRGTVRVLDARGRSVPGELAADPVGLRGQLAFYESLYLTDARLPSALVGLGLGLAIAAVAWRLRGPRAGAVAALLWASCPEAIAHAALATTDLPVAAFGFGATVALAVWLRARRPRALVAFALLAGAAAATKHSALPFLALGSAVALAVATLLGRDPAGDAAARRPPALAREAARAGLPLLAAGIAAAGLAAASFGFGRGEPGLAGAVPYLASLGRQAQHVSGGHPTYFLGQVRDHAPASYFAVAIALKWPLPLLTLALAGSVAVVRQREPRGLVVLTAVAAPAAALVALLSVGGLGLGVRYALPALPACVLLAGEGARVLSRRAPGRVAVAALVALQVAGTVRAHPDHLAWFNALAGEDGGRCLADSNLDWGQDLTTAVRWLRANGVERASFAYPLGQPQAYGFADAGLRIEPDGRVLPNAPVLVVSRNLLLGLAQGAYGRGMPGYAGLEPTVRLGRGTVWIFDRRQGPPLEPLPPAQR